MLNQIKWLLLFLGIAISQLSAARATDDLPPWTSVDQLIQRYVSMQANEITSLTLPTRLVDDQKMLSGLLCSSTSENQPISAALVGAASTPEVPLVLKRLEARGPNVTPHCQLVVPHQMSLREPLHLRVSFSANTQTRTKPYRPTFFKYAVTFNRSSRPSHIQASSTPDSAHHGYLHLWAHERDLESAKPIPTFVCLSSTSKIQKAEWRSPLGDETAATVSPLEHGCVALGSHTFSHRGTWRLAVNFDSGSVTNFELSL